MQKKKRVGVSDFFVLAVDGIWSFTFYFNITFLLLYFCVTKSTKSHLRGLSSLLKNSLRVHELVARAVRGECVQQGEE